jgi:SAM-dependent methyltransferase
MELNAQIAQFIKALEQSIDEQTFVALSLGNYKGTDEQLKNIRIKKILIKNQERLSFTYRYKTRDIVKNYDRQESLTQVNLYLNNGFRAAILATTQADWTLEIFPTGKVSLKKKPATTTQTPSTSHDKDKNRLIAAENKSYLNALNITGKDGVVFKNAQDKYRQINHYIEILSTLVKDIPTEGGLKVVDMGSGKGYLTFALYDYLTHVLQLEAEVTGVEFRPELVSLCNQIAENAAFGNLRFVQGTIEDYVSEKNDVLIALHACDTATDDAIFKGITSDARLIVVAPCCHKQIRREMEKQKVSNDVDFLTRYGIFLERQAEMVTDGIRAMILEYFGYKTKVFEFISDAHTPKNVMIVGVKNRKSTARDPKILQKIKDTKAYFGINSHHLEKMMGI